MAIFEVGDIVEVTDVDAYDTAHEIQKGFIGIVLGPNSAMSRVGWRAYRVSFLGHEYGALYSTQLKWVGRID